MSNTSVVHNTFVIHRTYNAKPERVFAAFASAEAKGRWFIGPVDWQGSGHTLDFRVGGRESLSGGPPGGPVHHFNSEFRDIVPNERIITTYEMHLDEQRISVSVATIELEADGDKTRLTYTEQGAFLDGLDLPKYREKGTGDLLDRLTAEIDGNP